MVELRGKKSREGKSEAISFRIAESTAKELRALAESLNTTVSDILNQMIEQVLEEHKSNAPRTTKRAPKFRP
jgi:predicted transcriptional regulator